MQETQAGVSGRREGHQFAPQIHPSGHLQGGTISDQLHLIDAHNVLIEGEHHRPVVAHRVVE